VWRRAAGSQRQLRKYSAMVSKAVAGIPSNDNGEPDYPDYVRDLLNCFRSIALPFKGGNELSVKVSIGRLVKGLHLHQFAGRSCSSKNWRVAAIACPVA
jgi:hypothetical protein